MQEINQTLREEIKSELEHTGDSILVLSKKIGLPQPQLHRFVHGTRDLREMNLHKIAQHLGYEIRIELVKPRKTKKK